jgi:hypothetical protein
MMNRILFITALLLSWNSASVWADGEDRSEAGTQWVDPVAFYDLMDIEGSDFKPDYDQGNVDVVNVMMKRGLKVYGLKLKPIAVAAHVEGVHPIGELDDIDYVYSFPYKDIMGIRGLPLNEPAFCVYADKGVSRSYPCNYNFTETLTFHYRGYEAPKTSKEEMRIETNFNLSDIRLVADEYGLGISYGMTVSGRYEGVKAFNEHKGQPVRASKEAGVDINLGHFIYYTGSQHLLLILSADQRDNLDLFFDEYEEHKEYLKPISSEQQRYLDRPWARVYFEVEEMLVEYDDSPILSEEERQEMVNYLDALTMWLSGEGDPLGLGEHNDATTSAVISTIGAIASLLLGNGLVGIMGGASSLVDSLVSNAGGTTPPPDIDMEGLTGRKPEEEEEKEEDTPPPPDKPSFLDKYSKVDSDGDLVVRDPVTGKETLYINNGDGTYRNFNTDQNWTPDEINEQLRYRDENSGTLKQDADQAAKNAAEQHAQWEKESQELSQDGKDYLEWKHNQEEAIRKEGQIKKLAEKYGVRPTEQAVKLAIRHEQELAQIEHDMQMDLDKQYEEGIHKLQVIDKTCEIGVNVMATCVPGGEAVKNAYTFAKSTLVAASEVYNSNKSLGEGIVHIAVGVGNGTLGVIQNQAGSLAGEGKYAWAKELGINVATEDLKEGVTTFYKTGDLTKTRDAMLKATGKKAAEFGAGKLLSYGTGKLKESATKALSGGESKMSEGLAKKVDYWFNKTHTGYLGHRANVFKVKVDGQKISIGRGQGFSLFYSGAVDTGKLTEGIINETLNQTGAHDWAGNLAQGVNDLGVEAAANVAYGAGVVNDSIVNFAKDVKDFSNLAANFGKK